MNTKQRTPTTTHQSLQIMQSNEVIKCTQKELKGKKKRLERGAKLSVNHSLSLIVGACILSLILIYK